MFKVGFKWEQCYIQAHQIVTITFIPLGFGLLSNYCKKDLPILNCNLQ